MARRHWLDPLARKVLQAMGDLPRDTVRTGRSNGSEEEPEVAPSWCIDVNRATAEQWRQLPGCSEAMVDQLIRLQQGGVQFSQIEDLAQLLNLPETLCDQWRPHLIFRWHGDAPQLPPQAPLDLNADNPKVLASTLLWPEDRMERLIAERRREPFQNLADLQERLCLPPAAVEALIGRVRFGARPAGPSLPPRG
jgi:DNA uptake protein ComE-like DNA-binding protein